MAVTDPAFKTAAINAFGDVKLGAVGGAAGGPLGGPAGGPGGAEVEARCKISGLPQLLRPLSRSGVEQLVWASWGEL